MDAGMSPCAYDGQMNNHAMLSKKQKEAIIKKYRTHESDTGSPQVQIALLSKEVEELTKHLKGHRKDYSSRRGLIKKVAERRRLLKYLEREDAKAFADIVEALGLKPQQSSAKISK